MIHYTVRGPIYSYSLSLISGTQTSNSTVHDRYIQYYIFIIPRSTTGIFNIIIPRSTTGNSTIQDRYIQNWIWYANQCIYETIQWQIVEGVKKKHPTKNFKTLRTLTGLTTGGPKSLYRMIGHYNPETLDSTTGWKPSIGKPCSWIKRDDRIHASQSIVWLHIVSYHIRSRIKRKITI